nr:MAG TPA: hypothetical protein [Caudoviricetes sp.]
MAALFCSSNSSRCFFVNFFGFSMVISREEVLVFPSRHPPKIELSKLNF